MGLPTPGHAWMTVVSTLAALATIVGLLWQLRGQPGGKPRARRRD